MLDFYVRPLIDPPLMYLAKHFTRFNVNANTVTFMGFAMGVMAMVFISAPHFYTAAFFLCLNRLFDGIDGAVARGTKLTDFGGFLDIVCDFIIYAGIVFSFCFVDPDNAPYAAFLIFSFVGPMTSFLAYAIMAAKRQSHTEVRGRKSFYYLGGLCEGTETAAVLLLMCLFYGHFKMFCLIYGCLCWITTMGRVYQAWRDFEELPGENVYKEPAKAIKSQGHRRPQEQ